MTNISLIILFLLIIYVSFLEIRDRNKKIKELEANWLFCRRLLTETRAILSEEQKREVEEIVLKKRKEEGR